MKVTKDSLCIQALRELRRLNKYKNDNLLKMIKFISDIEDILEKNPGIINSIPKEELEELTEKKRLLMSFFPSFSFSKVKEYFDNLTLSKDVLLDADPNIVKIMVLSDKSYKNLSNYKVPKEIRFDILKSLSNICQVIQVNPNLCYHYFKDGDGLAVYVHKLIGECIYSFFFIIMLSSGEILHDFENPITGDVMEIKKLIDDFYGDFMVVLTYIEFTDVSFDICYSNSKRGNILKGNDLINKTSLNVIQVNTNWNTTKLHIGSTFNVTGHWRLQPFGSNKTQYKYIFIDTYEKSGIIKRKAGKEIHI
jgi:hypothetical protein